MSRELVDKLLKEALNVANDRWARKGIDKSKQEIRISRKNLVNAFKTAFSKEHEKEFPGSTVPFSENDKVFNEAADASFTALRTHLNKKSTKSSLVYESTQMIVFASDGTYKAPISAIKKSGIAYINNALRSLGKAPLSAEQELGIQKGLERLHTNVTVGMGRLKYTLNYLKESGEMSDFFQSSSFKKIEDKYGQLLASYEIIDGSKGKEVRYTQTVGITLAPKSKNWAGSESKDWSKLKPKLDKALTAWIKTLPMEEQKGSKSPKQYIIETVGHAIMSSFDNKKNLTVKTQYKNKPKSIKRSKQTKSTKEKLPTTPKTVKARNLKTKVAKGVSVLPVHLMSLLNKDLPATVAKNMDSPRLNYETGRFASSVKITDIVQTPQGYPSIGYTYMKYPYQTFEPGYAQGDIDRDPRKLIDYSIREIAVQYAIGRFYTRRV